MFSLIYLLTSSCSYFGELDHMAYHHVAFNYLYLQSKFHSNWITHQNPFCRWTDGQTQHY